MPEFTKTRIFFFNSTLLLICDKIKRDSWLKLMRSSSWPWKICASGIDYPTINKWAFKSHVFKDVRDLCLARWWNCSWKVNVFWANKSQIEANRWAAMKNARRGAQLFMVMSLKTVLRGIIFIPAWNFKSNRCYRARKEKARVIEHVRNILIQILPRSFSCGNLVV